MSERKMFYGAKANTFDTAKKLRDNMTKSEKLLWTKLRNRQVLGLRFKSQHPIEKYIADFYCHKIKLVIEVDGGIHKLKDQHEYDINRTTDLNDLDIEVIRFTNEEVLNQIDDVIENIEKRCKILIDKTDSGLH